ncbi:helix-turn-helix domain-containing protein [Mycolicibacterium sp.]|uniref:helix-turn-helix domain-containing protein n=1 Tax=Mycolicibacterium sp. TaxID=2320850 RepID=UPI0037CC0056
MDREQPRSLLGAIIREQRELAALPMRQLAKSVGISNPYLSQIERGLRAPSEAVLEALAAALDLSAEDLYRRAGFVDPAPAADDASHTDLAAAIAAAPELTAAQRRAMAEIHRSFMDANRVRRAGAGEEPADTQEGGEK